MMKLTVSKFQLAQKRKNQCEYRIKYCHVFCVINFIHLFRKQLSCTICDYQTPKNSRLLLHLKKHDPKIRKKQTTSMQMCPDCGIFVNSSGSLKKHIRNVHLKLKHFFCDFCGYVDNDSILLH